MKYLRPEDFEEDPPTEGQWSDHLRMAEERLGERSESTNIYSLLAAHILRGGVASATELRDDYAEMPNGKHYGSHGPVNSAYGNFGKILGQTFGMPLLNVRYPHYWRVMCSADENQKSIWKLQPALMAALRRFAPVARYLNDSGEGSPLEPAERESFAARYNGEIEEIRRASRAVAIRGRRFRLAVYDAYHGRCPVTGYQTPEMLEAAHISQFAETGDNRVSNGILLWMPIHRLVDAGLARFEWFGDRLILRIAPNLPDRSFYEQFDSREVQLPDNPDWWPDRNCVARLAAECRFTLAGC